MAQKRWSTGVMGLGVLLLLLPFVGEQDSQAMVRQRLRRLRSRRK